MAIKEAIQGFVRELLNKPEDLAALRDALSALPAPPAPGRAVMDAAERKALGQELASSYDAVVTRGRAAADAKRAELEGQLAKARAALVELSNEQDRATYAYTDRRDLVMARLWAERPAEVDELIAAVEAEARELRPGTYNLAPAPPDPGSNVLLGNHPKAVGTLMSDVHPDIGSRQINNSESVERRRAALFALAEQLREWTRKGAYGSVGELREMYAKAHAALPAVEPLRDVMARDPRGRAALRVA